MRAAGGLKIALTPCNKAETDAKGGLGLHHLSHTWAQACLELSPDFALCSIDLLVGAMFGP
jgi:hypothetical protein